MDLPEITSDRHIQDISVEVVKYIKDAEGINKVFRTEAIKQLALDNLPPHHVDYIDYTIKMYT